MRTPRTDSDTARLAAFWAGRAALLDWERPWRNVLERTGPGPRARWFVDARLDVSANCLDRHVLAGFGDRAALLWQGEPWEETSRYTYLDLLAETCRMARVLSGLGVAQGDVVGLYLPALPELVVAALACARLGAVLAPSFAGLSPATLAERLNQCGAGFLITADASPRAGRTTPLKDLADQALARCPRVRRCLVVRRLGLEVGMTPGRDLWWHEAAGAKPLGEDFAGLAVDADHPLFILHGSGGGARPAGAVHAAGGFLAACAHAAREVLDLTREDILWSTADPGWIMGLAHGIYGPLLLGATTLLHEGQPDSPQPDRPWRVVEKFQATVLYTDPALMGHLMREGEAWPAGRDLSSLRLVASVGGPLRAEAARWIARHVCRGRAPVLDTWGQTATGGVLLAGQAPGPLRPLSGAHPTVLGDDGCETPPGRRGRLVLRAPWPGLAAGLLRDRQAPDFDPYGRTPAVFDTGDAAQNDGQGGFFVETRDGAPARGLGDDPPLAAIEAAAAAHPAVAEAAAVAVPGGRPVRLFVTLLAETWDRGNLPAEITSRVAEDLPEAACPVEVRIVSELPKTRSGKIARLALRRLAEGRDPGDLSGLADPSVLEGLIVDRDCLFA